MLDAKTQIDLEAAQHSLRIVRCALQKVSDTYREISKPASENGAIISGDSAITQALNAFTDEQFSLIYEASNPCAKRHLDEANRTNAQRLKSCFAEICSNSLQTFVDPSLYNSPKEVFWGLENALKAKCNMDSLASNLLEMVGSESDCLGRLIKSFEEASQTIDQQSRQLAMHLGISEEGLEEIKADMQTDQENSENLSYVGPIGLSRSL